MRGVRGSDRLSSHQVQTLADVFTTKTLTLKDGQPASVSGTFSAVAANGTQTISYLPGAYEDGLDVPSKRPTFVNVDYRASFDASLGTLPPILEATGFVRNKTDETVAFGDPFPTGWARTLKVSPHQHWSYASRGTAHAVTLSNGAFERRAVVDPLVLSPIIGAPHAIKVGGVDASHAAAVPFDAQRDQHVVTAAVVGRVPDRR
jgi:hypothetical protein